MMRSSTMRTAHFAQYLRVSSLPRTTCLSVIAPRLSPPFALSDPGLFAGKNVTKRSPDHPNGKGRDGDDREQVRIIRAAVAKTENGAPHHDDRGHDAAEPIE